MFINRFSHTFKWPIKANCTYTITERVILMATCIILVTTALLKLATLCGGSHILDLKDPLLQLSNRAVMFWASLLELIIVFWIVRENSALIRGTIIAVLGFELLLYHLIASMYGAICPCLGNAWQWVGSTPKVAVYVSIALAFLLTLFGITLIWRALSHISRMNSNAASN